MQAATTLLKGKHLSAAFIAEDLVEICLDRQNDSVNTLDRDCLDELSAALAQISADDSVRGVLLSSAKAAFLAGADISALWALLHLSEQEQVTFCTRMHQVFLQLDDLRVPVACAINGYALGGGLEAALCADHRVLADDAVVGFPEVGFGILPGAGGTVRAPRLAGAATALEWLTSGRSYSADKALAAGIVDAVASAGALRETALRWLRLAIDEPQGWQDRRGQRNGTVLIDENSLSEIRGKASKASKDYPAALAIAELVARCAPLSRDAAIEEEIRSFSSLAQTPTAKALVAIFMANQQIKRQSRQCAELARPLKQVAVLGAGIMGGGIAYTTALRGTPVVLKDIAQAQLDLGMGEARKLLHKQVDSGRLAPEKAERILASIKPTLDYDAFGDVDVVVEAVIENLQIKQRVLQQVEASSRAETVLASNTSSLAIGEIADPLSRPQNVVGMHFFNPVHMMPLVEVIRGPQSSDEAIATTVAYGLAMGKTPLVVKDVPGFLVNRLLGAYFTAFMQLIRDGADFVQIDRVMETWGWPMGPAYLLDVAGIDTLDKAMSILGTAYPDVMATDYRTVIQHLAAAGRYGQKTGSGFFRYERDDRGKPRRTPDLDVRALLSEVQPSGAQPFDDAVILDRMMLAMVLEADRCLEQQVIGSAIELDAGMRLGTGFPAHHVGPLWLTDRWGARDVLRRSGDLTSLGGLYAPGPGLRRRAQADDRYYATPQH
jgi:3-hydroxyacyl-CoA dehydrogenase/enoyl-CoA hydratase/3-hydroxybutyryl-CoA epimerase/enoyl-CoA isomerase